MKKENIDFKSFYQNFFKTNSIKNLFLISFVIYFMLLFVNILNATTYYVKRDGNNSDTGLSLDHAWATIQHAANIMVAGDTCKVQSGTYNEQVKPINSGTADNPITFLGEGMPTVTHTSLWEDNGVFYIDKDNITITGFNISAYTCTGVYAAYNSYAEGLTISNNYIQTDGARGIYFHSNAGSHSIIYNNEIHTTYKEGIAAAGGSHTDIEISYNTIYADENFQHQNAIGSGIAFSDWPTGHISYINVHHNKIWAASYTGIKIGAYLTSSGNCKVNYNEIGPRGYVHNGIELTMDNSEIIGNYIHDTDDSWAMYTNAIYCPSTELDENLIIKDNLVKNATGRALTVGGHQRNILVENFTATEFEGIGIEVFGFEDPSYPVELYTSDNIMFVNANLNIKPNSECPIIFVSLGTRLNDGSWARDDVTFINPTITGTYSRTTWWLTTEIAYEVNHHFEGTIYVINSNKDDVLITKAQTDPGTFDGEIIFYYYADVLVVDTKGNPVNSAKISFLSNNSAVKAKNLNYTYEPFPGTTQDIAHTYSGDDGHTSLPSDASSTVAIADFKKTISNTYDFEWTITAEKDGYSNSTTVNPDSSWYRENPNTYQNTVTIVLPVETGVISGIVTDTSGIPVAEATIVAHGCTTTTDTTGYYTMSLPVGNCMVTISKDKYFSQSKQAKIVVDEITTLNFQLICFGSSNKVFVYPNPYIKGKSLYKEINFTNLPRESTIKIYTISGLLVKTIQHNEIIDGGSRKLDISGIASGTYIYSITSSQGEKKGKVSLIK
ncbi:carboxypeptidase regulatory-like domain-containing protein [bacterium]|nr:carboxypeptidase regulatory-like domain-containing protein [bacterium]